MGGSITTLSAYRKSHEAAAVQMGENIARVTENITDKHRIATVTAEATSHSELPYAFQRFSLIHLKANLESNSCFTRYGCQSGCVDPPDFYLPPSSTPTPTPTPAPGWTTAQKSGLIAGVIVFTLVVILALLYWLYKKGKLNHQMLRLTRSEPNGISSTIEIPQSYARQNPMAMNNATVLTLNGQEAVAGGQARQHLLGFGAPSTRGSSGTNAMYNHDLDDIRVRDVSSETQV